ncbi:MAG: hypothetical protein Q7R39_04215 [Dehalococcoidia bacterium]|nr:hypothetical protein [Dehalococcoidia bacterium]
MGGEWIVECYKQYPKETERRRPGLPWDLDRVERDIHDRRRKRGSLDSVWKVDLQDVENHPAWAYERWWNKLSDKMGDDPVRFNPADVLAEDRSKPRKKLAIALWDRLKDMKVVSVHLRFILPDEFAIFSDPVIALLNLAPPRVRSSRGVNNRVEYYLDYLGKLRELGEYCLPHWPQELPRSRTGLVRIADMERALWCATHLEPDDPLMKAMEDDRFFQKMRLGNLLRDLGDNWKGTAEQQLTLAQALLKHDWRTAALLASRPFEKYLVQAAKKSGIKYWDRHSGKGRLAYFASRLEQENRKLPQPSFPPGRLTGLNNPATIVYAPQWHARGANWCVTFRAGLFRAISRTGGARTRATTCRGSTADSIDILPFQPISCLRIS